MKTTLRIERSHRFDFSILRADKMVQYAIYDNIGRTNGAMLYVNTSYYARTIHNAYFINAYNK